jgi:excisionase family DNA binding protein
MKPADLDPALEHWRRRLPASPSTVVHSTAARAPAVSERPRTVSEAAEELGLSIHTIRAWVACRRLAHLRLGRAIRIPAAEIRRIIEDSTVPAVQKE